MNKSQQSTISALVDIKILTVVGILAMLLASCSNSSNVNGDLLKMSRPTVTSKPNVKPTTTSILEAKKSSNESANAIKRAQQIIASANKDSKANAKVILEYRTLVEELRLTDDLMADKLAKLIDEYELLDKARIVVINKLQDELENASDATRLTTEALDYADREIMKLTGEISESWRELEEHRKQRTSLEKVVVKSGKDLEKANLEAAKYKEKYLKLTKYKWIVIGLGVWLLAKIIISLSSFTPQGRIAKVIF